MPVYEEDEYEDYDEYEEEEEEGEEEEEHEQMPTKESKEYLELRERLKQRIRKGKESGSGVSKSPGMRKKSLDNYGSFFGPSEPVIAPRVIQESKSLLENPHLLLKTPNPLNVWILEMWQAPNVYYNTLTLKNSPIYPRVLRYTQNSRAKMSDMISMIETANPPERESLPVEPAEKEFSWYKSLIAYLEVEEPEKEIGEDADEDNEDRGKILIDEDEDEDVEDANQYTIEPRSQEKSKSSDVKNLKEEVVRLKAQFGSMEGMLTAVLTRLDNASALG